MQSFDKRRRMKELESLATKIQFSLHHVLWSRFFCSYRINQDFCVVPFDILNKWLYSTHTHTATQKWIWEEKTCRQQRKKTQEKQCKYVTMNKWKSTKRILIICEALTTNGNLHSTNEKKTHTHKKRISQNSVCVCFLLLSSSILQPWCVCTSVMAILPRAV